jgi:hypothetical protein
VGVAAGLALKFGPTLLALLAEKIFGGKAEGGENVGRDVKAPFVLKGLSALLEAVKEPGVGLPGPAELVDLVESTVRQLNNSKQLLGRDTVLDRPDLDGSLLALGLRTMNIGSELIQRSGVIGDKK